MNSDYIDQIAINDFRALMVFVEDIKHRRKSNRGSVKDQIQRENNAIDKLFDAFNEFAEDYFRCAQDFIAEKNESLLAEYSPVERSRDYQKVLGRLIRHIGLLSDIARPHLVLETEVSSGNDQSAQSMERSLANKRYLIKQIVSAILTRFAKVPVLIPIFSIEFFYICFKYIEGVVVVGMPPNVLATPTWNLSVLWHEIGGHAVNVARSRGDFTQWAKELQYGQDNQQVDWWPSYEQLYQESEPVTDDETTMDASDWYVTWLGEFFEDLFGVQVLGKTMIETLVDAMARRNRDFDKADTKHPPSNLRVQVALELMDLLGYKDQMEAILKSLEARYDDLENLGLAWLDSDKHKSWAIFGDNHRNADMQKAAVAIAILYQSKLSDNDHEEGKFCRKVVSKEEQSAVDTVRSLREDFGEKFQNRSSLSRDLFQSLSEKETEVSSKIINDLQNIQNIGFSAEEQIQKIEISKDIKDLNDLLDRVKFADKDRLDWPNPPYG